MADLYRSTYDPRQLSGTSGAELSDLNPEQAYDTDLRRIEENKRQSTESLNDDQQRKAKFFAAAKTAGKFRQKAQIDEPTIRGKTPRNEAVIDGTNLPSMGDEFGTAGSVGYAHKPTPAFGRPYG